MHFGRITEKPTTDCVSLYNNAGLMSKVSEKIASVNASHAFSSPAIWSVIFRSCKFIAPVVAYSNMKAVLSQGNRAMPQLSFSPTTFSTILRTAKLQKPCFKPANIPSQKEFYAKWSFKIIQGHVFWSLWKGDQGLSNTKY